MIKEMIEAAVIQADIFGYKITEFQLGVLPMQILTDEVKKKIGVPVNSPEITEVTKYMGHKISKHDSQDAIMYCISPKGLL